MNKRVPIVVGPSTSGKTKIVFTLAQRRGMEIINGDKHLLYQDCPLGTGLSDIFPYSDVPHHLYGILGLESPLLTPEEYAREVHKVTTDIFQRKSLPIVEGCSHSYLLPLLQSKRNCYGPFIGIRIRPDLDIEERVRKRLHVAIENGLVQEVEQCLLSGHRHSYVLEHGLVNSFIVKYLRNDIDFVDALEKITQGALEIITEQFNNFSAHPEINWITHDCSDWEATINQVEDRIFG